MNGICAICGREEILTRHHLIPRTRHHNKRTSASFHAPRSSAPWASAGPAIPRSTSCSREKELERDYRTIEQLRAHADLRKFAEWIAAKPRGFRCPTLAGDR